MARPFPYTFISCPCVDTSTPAPSTNRLSKHLSNISLTGQQQPGATDDDDEEKTFDPRSARANYSLYPPEHLLYCEDCHQIKCPRCITEEIVCWYCPNCLFETPSSMVRSEGNRCARNCFNCPICTSPLAVTTFGTSENGVQNGPWILSCGYCMWTSLDIGIKFEKPTNIRAQLAGLKDEPSRRPSEQLLKSPLASSALPDDQAAPSEEKQGSGARVVDHDARFSALKSFYRTQISETSASSTDPLMGSDFGGLYSSPSALSRIMSLYTSGIGKGSNKKVKSKPAVMREALTPSEGLHIPDPEAEGSIVQKMASPDCGWDGLASSEQRAFHPPSTRFTEDLRPLPVFLRTKRSKRCKACKHILVKPEFKPQSTRFRIRLIALSYIPLTIIRTLAPPVPSPPINLNALDALKPIQFLLTLKNHMFDPIRITLATPSITPGRIATKVTMLCPQFEVGANSDVWDEALAGTSAPDPRLSRSGTEKVAEAGKVWDKGRNWTTVVMEVVPGSLVDLDYDGGGPMKKDDDVLELPVFVRVEWETEGGGEEFPTRAPSSKRQEVEMVKRELAYWMVLGLGRIKGR